MQQQSGSCGAGCSEAKAGEPVAELQEGGESHVAPRGPGVDGEAEPAGG